MDRPSKAADGTAVGLSFLCLVHCLLLPIILALFPALGGLVDLPEWLHLLLFALSVPLSSLATVAGYRRHGARMPGAIAACGLLLIGTGALAGLPLLLETSVTVAGSLLLAAGHICNWRIRRKRPRTAERL
jgi:hypothetical protein